MKPIIIERQWLTATDGRSCGTCYECCTWLGIEELKKWTGQSCKHLDGRIPDKRCGIYDSRPRACVEYYCMWRAGFGPEDLRPSLSGLLMTPYRRQDKGPEVPNIAASAVTILITDEEKAKTLQETVVMELIMLGVTEIRLVNIKRKTALLYQDGKIYQCIVLKSMGYEELTFEAIRGPIATYEVKNREELSDDQAVG